MIYVISCGLCCAFSLAFVVSGILSLPGPQLWHEDMTSGLERISLKFLGNLGWSVDEIRVLQR
jgi:uncharacterized protein YjeT (DUF2065 family)